MSTENEGRDSLVSWLAEVTHRSKKDIKRLIKNGDVAVDGIVKTDRTCPLTEGTCVTMKWEEGADFAITLVYGHSRREEVEQMLANMEASDPVNELALRLSVLPYQVRQILGIIEDDLHVFADDPSRMESFVELVDGPGLQASFRAALEQEYTADAMLTRVANGAKNVIGEINTYLVEAKGAALIDQETVAALAKLKSVSYQRQQPPSTSFAETAMRIADMWAAIRKQRPSLDNVKEFDSMIIARDACKALVQKSTGPLEDFIKELKERDTSLAKLEELLKGVVSTPSFLHCATSITTTPLEEGVDRFQLIKDVNVLAGFLFKVKSNDDLRGSLERCRMHFQRRTDHSAPAPNDFALVLKYRSRFAACAQVVSRAFAVCNAWLTAIADERASIWKIVTREQEPIKGWRRIVAKLQAMPSPQHELVLRLAEAQADLAARLVTQREEALKERYAAELRRLHGQESNNNKDDHLTAADFAASIEPEQAKITKDLDQLSAAYPTIKLPPITALTALARVNLRLPDLHWRDYNTLDEGPKHLVKCVKGIYSHAEVAVETNNHHATVKEIDVDFAQPWLMDLAVNDVTLRHKLKHPNILAVEGYILDGHHLYVQSRPHVNLRQWVKEKAPVAYQRQEVCRQLLQGLVHTHANSITHGALRGEAVAITANGLAQLTNFEFAIDNAATSSSILGHPAAPLTLFSVPASEQSPNSPPTHAIDMWHFGCILFDLFFDEPLLPGEEGPVIPPHDNERLRDLLLSLLRNQPEERLTAAEALTHSFFTTSYAHDLVAQRAIMDPEIKYDVLKQSLLRLRNPQEFTVNLNRSNLVTDFISQLGAAGPHDLMRRLRSRMADEPAIDEGGVSNDVITTFFSELLAPGSRYFEAATDADDALTGSTYLPRATCDDYAAFEACGKAMLKALLDERPVPRGMAPSLYKYLLDMPVSLQDLEAYDAVQASSLRNVLASRNVESMYLTFQGLAYEGESVAVDEDNKAEFVALKVKHTLVDSRRRQLEAVKKGFRTVDLHKALKIFNHTDLMMYLCGVERIDAALVLANMEFTDFSDASETPAMLREVIQELSQAELRRFVFLASATFSIPQSGLQRKITIKSAGRSDRLPVGHNCFNTIDMPDYGDKETLRRKVMQALDHCISSGFGFR